MSTSTPKILADGQVASSKTTIYTVPALTQAIVRTITFFNTAASSQTVILYIKKSGGTSRTYARATLAQNEYAKESNVETLDAGDILEAETTNATSVDYTVMGVEVA